MFDENIHKTLKIVCGHGLTRDAYYFAHHEHKPQYRISGDPFITHPINVAYLYGQILPADPISQSGCLLHDVIESTSVTASRIECCFGRFGKEISFMVDSLSKRPLAQFSTRHAQLAEYYSRLFPASLTDRRIAVIKMADRLHNVMTIAALEPSRALRILNETMSVFIPFFTYLNLPYTKFLHDICQQKLALLLNSIKHPAIYGKRRAFSHGTRGKL